MTIYLKCKISNNESSVFISPEDLSQLSLVEGVTFAQIVSESGEVDVKLNGRDYQKNILILESETLFNRARKLWKRVEYVIINDRPVLQTCASDLKEVTNLLLFTAQNLTSSKSNEIKWSFQKDVYQFVKLLERSILSFSQIGESLLNKLTSNSITLQSEPFSQYFHTYISIKYLILYIVNLCESQNLQDNPKDLMKDLLLLALNIYQKHKENILNTQPYPCLCIKKLWLYLIHYFKKANLNKFWATFNKEVANYDEEFIVWLLYHLSVLQLYDQTGTFIGPTENNIEDNTDLLVKSFQSLTLTSMGSDKRILSVLKLACPLLMDTWSNNSKIEPYQLLWEYFYKNLDSPCIGEMSIPKTLKDMIDLVDRVQNNPKLLDSSYEYFLFLLCNHLKRNPSNWNKMRGRIYSRLPPQKMNDFKNKALFQISILFITMSNADIGEALEKLYCLLENLSKDKQQSELIWIIYIGMAIISVRQNQCITKISTTLRSLVEEVVSSRDKFHLLKHYVFGLDIIMNSSQNYNLGQNTLLGPWMAPYMASCVYSDLCQLLNNLTCVIVQVENCGKWHEFKYSYLEYVLPSLKRVAISNSAPPEIGELVGKICSNAPEVTHATMQYFCNNCINIKVTYQFLVTILDSNQLMNHSPTEENLLISSWFRICILSTDPSHQDLSQRIFDLPSIRNIMSINNSDNSPYTSFVKSLGKEMDSNMNTHKLKELCEICFSNVDQWISGQLTPYTAESQIIYLYTTISIFFYICSPLLYHKSKSTCLFNRLITLLLLPMDVLMGKPPPANILKAIEKTWHLFVKGVYKLNNVPDPYIDRTLKDLVIRYVPHFSMASSPILKILDEDGVASIAFDKIASAFLLKSARSTEENTFKAMKTLQNILSHVHEESKIMLIIEKVFLGILEVLMFTNQKSVALDLIKSLIAARWYNLIQLQIQTSIQTITERHLAFNTSNYFQLVDNLIYIAPTSIRMSLPHIKKQIAHVEKMRGVGFDNTLRRGLDRIEKALS